MSDRIANLIDEYNRGIIPLERVEEGLEFLAWEQEKDQNNRNLLTSERIKLCKMSSPIENLTPEEILIERERCNDVLDMLKLARRIIGDRDYQILCRYVIDNATQETIAKEFSLTQSTISTILDNICVRISDASKKYSYDMLKETIIAPQSVLEAHACETRGYPYEFLQDVNVGGMWKTTARTNKQKFVSQNRCMLPEYFEQSFKDSNTVCNICENCDR